MREVLGLDATCLSQYGLSLAQGLVCCPLIFASSFLPGFKGRDPVAVFAKSGDRAAEAFA